MREYGRRRRRGPIVAVAVVAAGVVAVAGTAAGYLLLRTHGSPQQTAAAYLRGWERGDYASMDKVSVNVPRGGLAVPLRAAAAQLGTRSMHLALGHVTTAGGSAQAPFTATDRLSDGHVWTYRGLLRLVKRDRRWWVDWSPAAIYPGLRSGERFVLDAVWPPRAPVLAADGTDLTSPATVAQSGSLALLTGTVVRATAAQARKLGAPHKAGDVIGEGGIEEAYQERLAGRPSLTIRIEGPGRHVDSTAAHFPARPGKPVHTSIVMHDQLAASRAVSSAAAGKPIDLVALQPSTGKILAVVERPGGFNRALEGTFPPGSTFKVITGSALVKTGLRPTSRVQCPATVTLGGRTFHNFDNEHLGATSLLNAFAVSCNTTFAMLATQRLTAASLAAMARTFGFNARPSLGIPATLGKFTIPHQEVDLAADAFGQGTDLVNPLSEASIAAAVEDGTWRPPKLVTSPAPRQAATHPISPAILAALRPMMRAVVTQGTAAHVGFPPGVHGKTGTAEYGSGANPPSHAWFMGYRGDLAFAVIVEGGGVGADVSAPVANAFLRHL
jgi:Penicillin binding protein transpeptidase domain/NTF2-like N-terminal transpeptidase domain